jgi:DNA topoisomerase IB
MRLRRSDPNAPGYGRRRAGRGFHYVGISGRPLTDPVELQRIKELAIPPAWTDVWISPDPCGHLQAVGVDAAGRRQYLYHPQWRRRRDQRKFSHVRDVGGRLPRLRRRVRRDLAAPDLSRERVLALAARLLDRGLFRVGGDEYPTFGVATLRADHVRVGAGQVTFCYPAKGGIERTCVIDDDQVVATVRALRRYRRGAARLLAWCDESGWHELHASDINQYLQVASGIEMTAKDLRTWHATVLAAAALAGAAPPRSATAGRKAVASVMRTVSEELGNTPAVARASYVDPIVIEEYLRGRTIDATRAGPGAEKAVHELLG